MINHSMTNTSDKIWLNGPILSLESTEIEALFISKDGTGSRRARRLSPVAVVASF